MKDQITSQELSIGELSLWDENARFPDKYFSKTEKELITYFISQKGSKLTELAEDIVNDFDLLQLEKLVVYEINDKKIVLEGNRRLAVYKLLNNPDLIDDEKFKTKFSNLRTRIKISDKFKLECLLTKDKEQGLRYIERKHLRSNNEVSWGDNERAHHNARRGNANQKELLKVAITKKIKDLDFPEELKEQVLGPGFVTTLWRVIEQKPAWSIFGFNMNSSGELQVVDKEFEEKLKVVIFDVLQKAKFNDKPFSRLNVAEIEAYLKQISNNDYVRISEDLKKQIKPDLFGDEPIEVIAGGHSNKSNPKSSLRNYLIPKTCILQINQSKINNIYYELRNDLLIDDSKKAVPNAVGVLFRVFLEISLDQYAKVNGHSFKKDDTISQKIPWVTSKLQSKGYDKKEFSSINKVGSTTGARSYLSIENFHEYVHSATIQPSSSELKAKWDNLQDFFEILWKDINDKKKQTKTK